MSDRKTGETMPETWEIDPSYPDSIITADEGRHIADCNVADYALGCERAARIVREHNAYAAVVAALRRVVHAANANSHPIHYAVREAIDAARPALSMTEE